MIAACIAHILFRNKGDALIGLLKSTHHGDLSCRGDKYNCIHTFSHYGIWYCHSELECMHVNSIGRYFQMLLYQMCSGELQASYWYICRVLCHIFYSCCHVEMYQPVHTGTGSRLQTNRHQLTLLLVERVMVQSKEYKVETSFLS